MKEQLALRVLGEIMAWDDARAMKEYEWLRLMARMKYDGYQDFLAGVRFIECLASWLQQFDELVEREFAYKFVRELLIYVGPAEMTRLVELLFPSNVQRRLVQSVAAAYGVKAYQVWSAARTAAAYDRLLRQTLFIGLSEGARLDLFRRANAGVISNEQVLLATYADTDKWNELLADLRKDLGDPEARFAFVYLIDDFAGSGTTFIRKDSDTWKGKLAKFFRTLSPVRTTHFADDLTVCVHHYLGTRQAAAALLARNAQAKSESAPDAWFQTVEFTFGCLLPMDLPIHLSPSKTATGFIDIARKYFDSTDKALNKNKHIDAGGTANVALGFGECGLPLVLEHNTPNNSVALLWAETAGDEAAKPAIHAMRPLFRRRQRHT